MKTNLLKLTNHIFIISLVSLTLIMIWKEKPFFNLQLTTLAGAVLAYLIWAAVYHKLDKSLTMSIYIEYVLTAGLALILLLGVLSI